MSIMYESQDHWSTKVTRRDSGSEGAPLLSSGSHTSIDPVIFQDSETSDMESNLDSHSRYGSVGAASYSSTLTVLPKRLPPLIRNDALVGPSPSNASSDRAFVQEKCYEIHNIDLILGSEKYNMDDNQPLTNGITRAFLPGALSLHQDAIRTPLIDSKPKQSSLVTIFSIWNTILGSSLLTMPWGIAMAGFVPGIILILAMSGLCSYTAYRLLIVHKQCGGGDKIEVIELSRMLLGRWAEYVARIFSVTVLLGATIAYWILMSNFLYNSVNFVYDNIIRASYLGTDNVTHTSEVLCPRKEICNGSNVVLVHEHTFDILGPAWDLYRTVPTFLALLIFPFLNFNSATFFTKFNSLGTTSIIYLIIFVIIKSVSWGINMDDAAWKDSWVLKPTFPALSGMLALSFFIHNIIITIMQNNHDQRKNGRDLTIAYVLVTITYILVGAVFFTCFPLPKSCIEDNLLNNFQKWDGLTVGARVVLLFQLLTVYPLLTYMLRVQVLSALCKVSSTRTWTLLINLTVVSVCILFATFVPRIGTIIRYTGAISGLIYVFALPSLLHMAILKRQGKLTICSLLVHVAIPLVGVCNLIAQFFISDR